MASSVSGSAVIGLESAISVLTGWDGMGDVVRSGGVFGSVSVLEHADLDFCGGFGCADRSQSACHEYHQDGAVENGLVHHAVAVGHNHVVTDGHHGEGHCGVGCGQTEHHAAVYGGHAVGFLGYECGKPFAHYGHHEHNHGHHEGVPLDYHAHIDHHADTDKEIGDEKSVAHELDAVHQRGGCRDVAVEHQSGEECAEHRLQTYGSGHPCRQEHHHHHVDVLRHLLAVAF